MHHYMQEHVVKLPQGMQLSTSSQQHIHEATYQRVGSN